MQTLPRTRFTASLRTGRLAGASALAAVLSATGGAALAQDTRDDRIAALEAQLRSLAAQVAELRAGQAGQAGPASQPAQGSPVAPQAAQTPSASQGQAASTATDRTTAAPAQAPTAPVLVALPNGRPSFSTSDKRFTAAVRGVLMFDAAKHFQDPAGPAAVDLRRGGGPGETARARDLNDGTNFRRVRLGVEGKVFNDFDYNLLFEFGGSGAEDAGHIQEAWLQYSGFEPFGAQARIRLGAFEPQVSLAANTSTSSMILLERPSPAEVARGLAGGDFRSGLQVQMNGDLGEGRGAAGASWLAAAAVTGGTVGVISSTGGAGGQGFDEQLGFTGRLALAPRLGARTLAHFGLNGSHVPRPADALGPDAAGARHPIQFRDRPELRVDATRLVDTGPIDAESAFTAGVELALQRGPVLIEGEYFRLGVERRSSALADPRFDGWYLGGSWVLTGEPRRYNAANGAFDGPSPRRLFDPAAGGWGAFELAGRYSDLDLNFAEGEAGAAPSQDAVRGGEQRIWSLGLNWYLNPSIRFMLQGQHVDISRLSPNASTFNTPVGAEVGQDYNAVAMRAQFGF